MTTLNSLGYVDSKQDKGREVFYKAMGSGEDNHTYPNTQWGLVHFTYQLMVGFELVVSELVVGLVWVPQIGVPLSNPIPFIFGDPKKSKPPGPKPPSQTFS